MSKNIEDNDEFEEEEDDIYEEVVPRSMKAEVTEADKDGFQIAAKRFYAALAERDPEETKKSSFAILDFMDHVYMAGAATNSELLELASACVMADSIQSISAAKSIVESPDFVQTQMFEDLFLVLAERTDSKLQKSDSKKSQFGKLMKTYRTLFNSIAIRSTSPSFANPDLVVIWERLFRVPNPYDANLLDFIDHTAIVEGLNHNSKVKLLKSLNTFMDANSSSGIGSSVKGIWRVLGKGAVREILNGCLLGCQNDVSVAPVVSDLFATCFANMKQPVWCNTDNAPQKGSSETPRVTTTDDPDDSEDYCPLQPLTEFNMSIHENVVYTLLKLMNEPIRKESINEKSTGESLTPLSEAVCPKITKLLAQRLGAISQLGYCCTASREDCSCKLDPISALCRDVCFQWLTRFGKIEKIVLFDEPVTGIVKFTAQHPSMSGYVAVRRLYPTQSKVIRKHLSWLFRTGFRCCFQETEQLLDLVIRKDLVALSAEDTHLVVKMLMKHSKAFERLLERLKEISDCAAWLIPIHDTDFYRLAEDQYAPSPVPAEIWKLIDAIIVNVCSQCSNNQQAAMEILIAGCRAMPSLDHNNNVLAHLQELALKADTKYLVEGQREWLEELKGQPETQEKADKILRSLVEEQTCRRKSKMCIVC